MSTLNSDLPFTTFPYAIQTFTTMLNMTASDGSLVKQFQTAMENSNTALAQSIYAQITNADAKFVDATKLNTLMQTCIALQRFYLTDIEPYIATKQTEWQGIINQFTYEGVYDASTQYVVNNFVMYNVNGADFLYLCLVEPPIGTLPTNTNYWRVLTIRGAQGISGVGVSFVYEWKSDANYILQDVVTYNNAVWGCIQPNVNQIPAEGSLYWKLIYSTAPTIYPFQVDQPTSPATGDLWFKILSVG